MGTTETSRAALRLSAPCPRCGAPVGDACVGVMGQSRLSCHQERWAGLWRRRAETPRRHFVDGYARMAWMTMEAATGTPQAELAKRVGLSTQRVHQIVRAGYARAGCRSGDRPEVVALGLRRADAVRQGRGPRPDTPEWFWLHERFHEVRRPEDRP